MIFPFLKLFQVYQCELNIILSVMCSVYYEYAVDHAVRGFFPTVLKTFL